MGCRFLDHTPDLPGPGIYNVNKPPDPFCNHRAWRTAGPALGLAQCPTRLPRCHPDPHPTRPLQVCAPDSSFQPSQSYRVMARLPSRPPPPAPQSPSCSQLKARGLSSQPQMAHICRNKLPDRFVTPGLRPHLLLRTSPTPTPCQQVSMEKISHTWAAAEASLTRGWAGEALSP